MLAERYFVYKFSTNKVTINYWYSLYISFIHNIKFSLINFTVQFLCVSVIVCKSGFPIKLTCFAFAGTVSLHSSAHYAFNG